MKIINLAEIREKINKLDNMAQTDHAKPSIVFPQNEDNSIKSKMERFFTIADGGNPEWNV